jgi:hypothetical protein
MKINLPQINPLLPLKNDQDQEDEQNEGGDQDQEMGNDKGGVEQDEDEDD